MPKKPKEYPKVTRVEVINHTNYSPVGFVGAPRAYSFMGGDIRVSVSLQDDDRTLKIFIEDKQCQECMNDFDEFGSLNMCDKCEKLTKKK
jgi:hypothetical protein